MCLSCTHINGKVDSPLPSPMSDIVHNQWPDAMLHQCQACGLYCKSAPNLQHHHSARHSILSFISSSKEYVITSEWNGYACPLANCSQQYHNWDGLQCHLHKHHGVKFLFIPFGDARLSMFISEDLLNGSNARE